MAIPSGRSLEKPECRGKGTQGSREETSLRAEEESKSKVPKQIPTRIGDHLYSGSRSSDDQLAFQSCLPRLFRQKKTNLLKLGLLGHVMKSQLPTATKHHVVMANRSKRELEAPVQFLPGHQDGSSCAQGVTLLGLLAFISIVERHPSQLTLDTDFVVPATESNQHRGDVQDHSGGTQQARIGKPGKGTMKITKQPVTWAAVPQGSLRNWRGDGRWVLQ